MSYGELCPRKNTESIEKIGRTACQLPVSEHQVEFEIGNWSAIAEGRKPGQITGGVYAGVEDFIGSPQRGPPRGT